MKLKKKVNNRNERPTIEKENIKYITVDINFILNEK